MKSTFWNSIKGNAGFSLPEVMIGGAILAGVALTAATLFKDQTKAQQRINFDQQLNQFHGTLTKMLDNVHNCNATYSSAYGSTSIGPSNVPGAYVVCANNCNLEADAQTVVPGTAVAAAGSYIETANSKQVWMLQNVAHMNTLTATGQLRIRFTYQLNPRLGNRTVTKDSIVNMRFDKTGKFVECFNDQESTVNNLQNDLCDAINSTGVDSNGRLTTWDENLQKCVLTGSAAAPVKDCTAAGMMVEGISSGGVMHCRPISTGFDPAPLINGSTTTCAAGSNATLVFSGGQLSVQCL